MQEKQQCAVITAYKGRDELLELLTAIHNDMHCFVHIDTKSVSKFADLKKVFPDVHFYSKYSVNWGGTNIY